MNFVVFRILLVKVLEHLMKS